MEFTWDPVTARYRDARGRFVTRLAVRRALDYALRNADKEMRAFTEQLRRGEIDLATWRQLMREAVKNVHLYSAAAARGGWDRLEARELGRVGRIVRDHYAYLERFVRQIAQGEQALDGQALRRSAMYGEAGRKTYESFEVEVLQGLGFDQERNLLGPTEHHCKECPEITAMGWQPIGTLPAVGDRECITACLCRKQYRRTSDGATTS